MRNLLLAAVCATALAACGDHGFKISKHMDIDDDDSKAMRVVTQLVCPDHQGDLTRVRTAPDGASCDYAGPRGAQVTLSLIKEKADEDPEALLKPLENQLAALMPTAMAKLAKDNNSGGDSADAAVDRAQKLADQAQAAADKARDAADKARDQAEDAADKARDRAEAAADSADTDSDDDHHRGDADVKLPGVSVKSHGDNANVSLPGIHVDANDGGAHINIAGIRIDADDDKRSGSKSGRVNINADNNDVSIRAEDHAAEIRAKNNSNGLRMTYVLANDEGDTFGWKTVGYEARGPKGGPIVVAVVKSKDRHEDPIFKWAKELVRKNVEP